MPPAFPQRPNLDTDQLHVKIHPDTEQLHVNTNQLHIYTERDAHICLCIERVYYLRVLEDVYV